jgi:hypothetical protein
MRKEAALWKVKTGCPPSNVTMPLCLSPTLRSDRLTPDRPVALTRTPSSVRLWMYTWVDLFVVSLRWNVVM